MNQSSDNLHVWLVDPSLFTAPYDAALSEGLVAAGTEPLWITRPTRKADRQELPIERTDPFFYRHVDEARWIPGKLKSAAKGIAHFMGLVQLLLKVRKHRPDVVHMQWIIVPPLDTLAMMLLRRWAPLVLTVHDTVPFNGQKMSWLQRFGHAGPTRLAHRVIVHTRSGRQALIDQGVPAGKVAVIPHGPLTLATYPPPRPAGSGVDADRDPRWTFVLFGEIKPYKGIDVMIDAVAALPEPIRKQLRVVVAGRPRMDVSPLLVRIAEAGLTDEFQLRLNRLSEEEMAVLFDEADTFVFPYRQIDASGVYFLVKSLGKWLIASRVGVFAEDVIEGTDGALIPADDAMALADQLQRAVTRKPRREAARASDSWAGIGRSTRTLYEEAIAEQRDLRVAEQQGLAG